MQSAPTVQTPDAGSWAGAASKPDAAVRLVAAMNPWGFGATGERNPSRQRRRGKARDESPAIPVQTSIWNLSLTGGQITTILSLLK